MRFIVKRMTGSLLCAVLDTDEDKVIEAGLERVDAQRLAADANREQAAYDALPSCCKSSEGCAYCDPHCP